MGAPRRHANPVCFCNLVNARIADRERAGVEDVFQSFAFRRRADGDGEIRRLVASRRVECERAGVRFPVLVICCNHNGGRR